MEIKTYNFSTIGFAELKQIVDIYPKLDEKKFEKWFSFDYKFSESERFFLEDLIKKHKLWLSFYQEETLKVKFIGAILNSVDFTGEGFRDWYDVQIAGTVNGIELKGYADYLVAKGDFLPEKPYFFIQEFKPSIPDKNPEPQLLAEMLVCLQSNELTQFYGAYVIGQYWKFVILEKATQNTYTYVVSEAFDALKIADLTKIYTILQATKAFFGKK